MAISADLRDEILIRWKISNRTLQRVASDLKRAHGPIDGDEARGVIAVEAGIDLAKYGWTKDRQERVRSLRVDGATSRLSSSDLAGVVPAKRNKRAEGRSNALVTAPPSPTRAMVFDARHLHPTVVRRSRRAFVARMNDTAVERAFRSVNNRIKQLIGTRRDGVDLMGFAFSPNNPKLQMSPMDTESEENEQKGVMFIAQGAMTALRNPRAHDDEWEADKVDEYALDALAVASFLHRTIDRCEDYAASIGN